LFSGLEPALRDALAARTETVHVTAGQWLFRQGDTGDAMYIVRAGRLQAVDERAHTVLRELGRGDAVGELALLTDSARAAGVRAVRGSDLIAIGREDFDEFLRSSPALSLALTRSLAEQLRETGAPATSARPRPATVAVVRLERAARGDTISRDLADALSRYLTPVLLEGSEVSEPASSEEPAAVYGPLLDRAEGSNDLVLLDAGSVANGRPWDEFCLQQADRILALTYADQTVGPGGERVSPVARRAEMLRRHGPHSWNAQVDHLRGPHLETVAARVESRLGRHRSRLR
jgi:CRP-like cAMP-binding protein